MSICQPCKGSIVDFAAARDENRAVIKPNTPQQVFELRHQIDQFSFLFSRQHKRRLELAHGCKRKRTAHGTGRAKAVCETGTPGRLARSYSIWKSLRTQNRKSLIATLIFFFYNFGVSRPAAGNLLQERFWGGSPCAHFQFSHVTL